MTSPKLQHNQHFIPTKSAFLFIPISINMVTIILVQKARRGFSLAVKPKGRDALTPMQSHSPWGQDIVPGPAMTGQDVMVLN